MKPSKRIEQIAKEHFEKRPDKHLYNQKTPGMGDWLGAILEFSDELGEFISKLDERLKALEGKKK